MRVTILVLIALLLTIPASAKNDAYVEDLLGDWGGVDAPLALPAPLDWKAIHGRLGEYGDIDAFSFSFEAPEEDWAVEVRVGVCGEHFEAVYPSIALIGAGLETAEGLELPFELAEGVGAVMVSQSAVADEERAVDTEFSFYYETPDVTVFNSFYEESELIIDIPEAGDYTLAIWEPDGHVGAYFLWTGNQHPEDMDSIDWAALEDTFMLINTGAWMGQDCEAPLEAEDEND